MIGIVEVDGTLGYSDGYNRCGVDDIDCDTCDDGPSLPWSQCNSKEEQCHGHFEEYLGRLIGSKAAIGNLQGSV